MAEFTMELNDEQKEVRDWLHGFAAGGAAGHRCFRGVSCSMS